MVKLEEVQDEAFVAEQQGEEDWDTDSDSDLSSIASDEDLDVDESILERITALKDWAGSKMWVVSVSVLLLVTPFALAAIEDQQIAMEEKQMSLQQSANEIMTPGSTGSSNILPAQQSL